MHRQSHHHIEPPTRDRGRQAASWLGAGLTVLAIGLPGRRVDAQPLFESSFVTLDAGGDLVAVRDLDGDGIDDLVVTNRDADVLSVVLSGGERAFRLTVRYKTGLTPQGLALGDFNEDGNPDIAVVSDGFGVQGMISLHLGTGGGSFADPIQIDVGRYPEALAAGDFNGDHHLDLVITQGDDIVLWFGDGHGGLRAGGRFYAGNPHAIVAADLNGDSRLDVVISHTSAVSVLLGRGDGTFSRGLEHNTGTNTSPTSIALADLNGDGKLDLVTNDEYGDRITFHLGHGDGNFEQLAYLDYRPGDTPDCVAIADVNEDGRGDLLVGWASRTVDVLLGNGDGTFRAPAGFVSGGTGRTLAAGDLDGDGHLDAVLPGGQVSVLYGHGDGTFGFAHDFVVGPSPLAVVARDLDADGHRDLAVTHRGATAGAPSGLAILLGRGDGSFVLRSDFDVPADPLHLLAADLDKNGTLDLIVGGARSGLQAFLGDGRGGFRRAGNLIAAGSDVALGDVNADGFPDLAFVNDTVHLALGKGDGTFASPTQLGDLDRANSAEILDWNEDRRPDVVVGFGFRDDQELYRGSGVAVFLGAGDGTFAPNITGTAWPVAALTPGDIDRDGHFDLVMQEYYPRERGEAIQLAAFLGNGRDGGYEIRLGGPSNSPSMILTDLDLDGKRDLVFTLPYQNGVFVRFGNGAAAFGTPAGYGTGSAPYAVAAADLDGDGRPDLAVANSGSNTVSVLLNRGRGPTPIAIQDLRASVVDGAVRLAWSIPAAAVRTIAAIRVQRSERADGPYVERTSSPLAPSLSMTFVDAEADAEAWYRLDVEGLDGNHEMTPPVQVAATESRLAAFLGPPRESTDGSRVEIRYRLGSVPAHASLAIFNLRGEAIRIFTASALEPGEHFLVWDRRDQVGHRVARGVYIVALQASKERIARKCVLLHR